MRFNRKVYFIISRRCLAELFRYYAHGIRTCQRAYLGADPFLYFGFFTDSDFIGGGTDGKGHIFRGSYALTKNVSLGGTLFINERGENSTGSPEDYDRLMLDVEFKY